MQKLPFAIWSTSLLCGLLPVRARAALVASLLAAVLMMATNDGFLGWYWFPTLVVQVASLLWANAQASRCLPVLITCLGGSAVAQAPPIAQAITRKKTHDALFERGEAIQASLRAALRANEPIDFVFDLSDVDLHLDLSCVSEGARERQASLLRAPTRGAYHRADLQSAALL